jgi:hypothetical protein
MMNSGSFAFLMMMVVFFLVLGFFCGCSELPNQPEEKTFGLTVIAKGAPPNYYPPAHCWFSMGEEYFSQMSPDNQFIWEDLPLISYAPDDSVYVTLQFFDIEGSILKRIDRGFIPVSGQTTTITIEANDGN